MQKKNIALWLAILWTCGTTCALSACRGDPPTALDDGSANDSGRASEAGDAFGPSVDAGTDHSVADSASDTGSTPADAGDATTGNPDASDSGSVVTLEASVDACAAVQDTLHDPNNCGRCGHGCLGGACDGGVCLPVVLASPVTYPIAITVDSANVYWAEDEDGSQNFTNGAVRRLSLASDGGIAAAVALGGPQVSPTNIAISSGGLYWVNTGAGTTAGSLVWSSNPSVASTQLDTWAGCQGGLALATNKAYWMTCPANGVGSSQTLNAIAVPSQGASAQTLVGGPSGGINCTEAMVADSAAVYWLQTGCGPNAGAMWKLLFSDATQPINLLAQTTLSGPYSRRLAVDDHAVYFSSGTTGIAYAPLAGGNPTAVNATASANGIAVDATNIYWTDPVQNAVVYAPLPAGTPVTVLAPNQSNPYDIQVDTNAVYWTNYTNPGAIMKVAKP